MNLRTYTSTMSPDVHIPRSDFIAYDIPDFQQCQQTTAYYWEQSASPLCINKEESCQTARTVCPFAGAILLVLVNVKLLLIVLHTLVLQARAVNKFSCLLFISPYITKDCTCISHSTWLHAFSEKPYNYHYIYYRYSFWLEEGLYRNPCLAMKCTQWTKMNSSMVAIKSNFI